MLPFQLDLLMLLIKMAQHLKFSSSHEVVHKLFDNEWGHSGICYYSRWQTVCIKYQSQSFIMISNKQNIANNSLLIIVTMIRITKWIVNGSTSPFGTRTNGKKEQTSKQANLKLKQEMKGDKCKTGVRRVKKMTLNEKIFSPNNFALLSFAPKLLQYEVHVFIYHT